MNKFGKMNVAAFATFLGALLATTTLGQQPAQPKPPARPAVPRAKTAASSTEKKQAARQATPAATRASGAGEKVVLKVDTDQVTREDMEYLVSKLGPDIQKAIAQRGLRPIGEHYALILILSGQAVSSHLDTSPDIRRQLALQRMQVLAQAEYENLLNQSTVSPEAVSQYYTEHAAEFEEAQIRQVVIRKKPEGAKEDAPGLAANEARTRADQIRKALTTGGDINKVVQDFSVPNVVVVDAEPRSVRRGQMLAEMEKAAFQLKEGEVSDPIETPQALVLVQAGGRRRLELKDVSAEIEGRLREKQVEATINDLRSKHAIWMDDEYFGAPAATTGASTPSPPSESKAPNP